MDTIAPVITLNGEGVITHEAGSVYVDENATRTDAIDGTGVVLAAGEVDTTTPGTYTLTYDYTDAAGNAAAQVTRTVTVEDTTIPVITLNGDEVVTHEGGVPYNDDNATWTDIVDGTGTIIPEGDVNVMVPRTYILNFNYTDAAGNEALEVNRTVEVQDTIAPVITLNGEGAITHEAGSVYVDENATRTDAVDGTGVVLAAGEVDTTTPGIYTLTYDYTDTAGNTAVQVTRTVTVEDTTIPVITLNGDEVVTHEGGVPYYDDNATWTDIVDGTGKIIPEGDVNVMVTGTYTLNFNHTDTAGNEALEVNRTVEVLDTIAPVITLNGEGAITHEAGSVYVDENATRTDAVDGSGVVLAAGEVDTTTPGIYTLTYDYRCRGQCRSPGNPHVTVEDTTIPVITLNGDEYHP